MLDTTHALGSSPDRLMPADLTDLILNSLDSAVIALDADARVMFANDYARLYGLVSDGRLASSLAEACQRLAEGTGRAIRFHHDERSWYCRMKRAPGPICIVFVTAERMREAELLRRFQLRYQLTDRQVDMLRHLLRGSSVKNAAEATSIRPRTAARHVSALLESLGVDSVAGIFPLAEALRREAR
jgi:DNA-binding NarL/FixJ family response regulator